MDLLTEAALCGLAAWRLAAMLVYEEGPGNIFGRFRAHVGIPESGEIRDGFLPALLSCIWCTSVWTAALMVALVYVGLAIVPEVLAAAAVALMAERIVRG